LAAVLRSVLISVVALFLSSLAAGAESRFSDTYFWPLKLDKQFSSGFGDSRSGRFHKGIDLRTVGKEGAMVYAPEDGWVWRIKTSYRGYGKALYLKGISGRIYVFYHLQRYNKDIGNFLRDKQIASRRYYQDLDPGAARFPVKRGEYIARTGQTGAGAPHLHFEVRDPDDRPTNPLNYAVDYQDTSPPKFEAVWLAYLDDASLFAGGSRELKLDPIFDKATGSYSLKDTLTLTGRFAFKAAVDDRASPGSFMMGPSRIRLLIDGRLYHEVDYSRLDFAEDKYIVLDRDFDPAKAHFERVFNLYRKTGNNLSLYGSESFGDGSFSDTIMALHTAVIEASDPRGNASRMTFAFYYLPGDDVLAPLNMADFSDSLITLYLAADANRMRFDSVSLHLSGESPGQDTLPVALYPKITVDATAVRLRGDFRQPMNYQLRFWDRGAALPPYYFSTRPVTPNGRRTVDTAYAVVADGGILLTARSSVSSINWLTAEIRTDQTTTQSFFRTTGGQKFSLFYRPGPEVNLIESVIIRGPVGLRPDTLPLNIRHIPAGTTSELGLAGGGRVVFGENDLFDDALLTVADTVLPASPKSFIVAGPWTLGPKGLSFAAGADVRVTIPDLRIEPSKVGMCLYNGGGWSWWGGVYDSSSKSLKAALAGTGMFAVLADTAAPVISALNIDQGEQVKISHPTVRFTLTDDLSGVEDDRSFNVTIDGDWMVPEYDPERRTCVATPHWRLTGGRHKLRIEVCDRCGNQTVIERGFWVGAKTGP